MDDALDFLVNLEGKCEGEEYNKKVINYLIERYGDGLF
jgi:hypothetical protein